MIGRWIFLRSGAIGGRTWAMLALLFALTLVVLPPLRVVLGMAAREGSPISAAGAHGPMWAGRIVDLRAGPFPLGTLDARIKVLPLLIGRSELQLERGGEAPFAATVSGSDKDFRLSGVTGTVPIDSALGGFPATRVGFADFAYRSEAGRCAAAAGTVSLTLAPLSPLIPADMVMGGRARCDRGALYVPMAGPTGMERLFLRVEPSGAWTADVVLTGLPDEVARPLLEQGFTARPGGIAMRVRGKL